MVLSEFQKNVQSNTQLVLNVGTIGSRTTDNKEKILRIILSICILKYKLVIGSGF